MNIKKSAHVSAYFLLKSENTMPILKLQKLLYLADRESMDRYDLPITFDHMVSMPHGPVLSVTLNLINGYIDSEVWKDLISDKADHAVALAKKVVIDDLDELSRVDIEILDSIWEKFGAMDQWTIRDYTHDNCPEWKDPEGSMLPINYETVFLALGRPLEEARELGSELGDQANLNRYFSQNAV